MDGMRLRGGAMPCAITFCLGTQARVRPATAPERADFVAPLALVLALVLVSLAFVLMPEIDLWVSGRFAGPAGGFPLAADPMLVALRDLNRALPIWIVSALVAALVLRAALGRRARQRVPAPSLVLVVLGTYLAGPLGIVHALKNTVGRARPQDVLAFGGEHAFTTAWALSDACSRNCSFSSGEAASAAVLPLLAILAPLDWRGAAFALLCVPAAFFSLNRVAFGSHFLSDVLVSWLLVALATVLVHRLVAARADRLDALVDGRLRPMPFGLAA